MAQQLTGGWYIATGGKAVARESINGTEMLRRYHWIHPRGAEAWEYVWQPAHSPSNESFAHMTMATAKLFLAAMGAQFDGKRIKKLEDGK